MRITKKLKVWVELLELVEGSFDPAYSKNNDYNSNLDVLTEDDEVLFDGKVLSYHNMTESDINKHLKHLKGVNNENN